MALPAFASTRTRCLAALFLSVSPLAFVQCVSDDPSSSSDTTSDAGGSDSSSDSAVADAGQSDSSTSDSGVDAGPPPAGTFASDLILPDITIASSIATAANGDTVLGGELTDSNAVIINGLSYSSAGSLDHLIVKVAPNNGIKWVKTFGGTGDDRVNSVAIDTAGNVYVAGYVTFATAATTITFGTSPAVALTATHAGQSSVFMKLDATDGHPLWAATMDEATTGTAQCDAIAASGTSVAVACGSAGDLDIRYSSGDTSVPHQSGRGEVIALIDPASGDAVYTSGTLSAMYLNATTLLVPGLAFDQGGGLAIAGSISSNLSGYASAASTTTATYTLTRLGTNPSASDAFVLKVGSGLAHTWDKVFGAGTQRTAAARVAVDATGKVYVAGNFGGTVDFGGGATTAIGTGDAFVVGLDTTGKEVAQTSFGGTGSGTLALGLAIDPDGDVVTSGTYQGAGVSIKIGATTLPTTNGGAWAAFTTRFDGALTAPYWAYGTAYPGATTTSTGVQNNGVTVDPTTHQVLSTGTLIGTADLGDGTSVTRSNATYFVRRAR